MGGAGAGSPEDAGQRPDHPALESVRAFVAGIAHDFNNVLGTISLHLGFAKMYVDPGQEVFERLAEAEKVCLRAQALVQQLLAFFSRNPGIRRATALGDLLGEAVPATLVGRNLGSTLSVADDLWPVECDPAAISHVVSALLMHATWSAPRGGGIEVKAENALVGAEEVPGLEGGRYVRLSIGGRPLGRSADGGSRSWRWGFDAARACRNPGLASAWAILKEHTGQLGVAGDGNDVEVEIYLPAAPGAAGLGASPPGGR